MNLSGHQSARMGSDSWLTPPEWIAALGPFDLDPCCPPDMPWPTAKVMLTKDSAGGDLTKWQGGCAAPWHGRVWLNPPFGREAHMWLLKLAMHGNGIGLIPARTETEMFYECVWGKAHGVCFVKGRPHFHYPDGKRAPFNSGAPIALVAYGLNNLDALIRAGLGITLTLTSRDGDGERHG